ncbi:MAG: DUF481 domain-containing protein [Planctomycetes bacterium]|nr:DUF481 domain-containing protein [Planctomycetota bacterium]
MNFPILRALAFFCLLSSVCFGFAVGEDVLVTLNSGEVLRGEVISDKDGVVMLKHALLGELKINRDAIVKISPAPALPAPPVAKTPPAADAAAKAPATKFAEKAAEPASVPAETSRANEPSSEAVKAPDTLIKSADYTVVATPAELAKAAADAAKDPHEPVWKGQFEFNATFVDAVNTQFDLRAAAQVTRETIDDKLKAYAEYYFRTLSPNTSSSGNGNITDNNLLTNITYDRFLNPTPWLLFGKGQYQYDMTQNWENRISAWGGVGYRFFDDPKKFTLTGKLGLGATHEFGSSDMTQPNGYAEIAMGWQISERQKLNFSSYISPDLANFNNYFIQTRLEWSMKIDLYTGLSVVAGLRDDYQSQPSNGSTGNDFRGYFGLKLEL